MSWRIFEKWFNVAPWKDAEYITDNSGEKFWIYWRDKFEHARELHVWYRGHWVGVVNSLHKDDNSLTLADIIIFERYNLRRRSLGKAMIKEVIRWAKEHHIKHIWGFIKSHDGSTNEYLQEWYRRQGFEVYEAKPGVFHILLKLQGEQNGVSR
jgi:GNAT superfamily N-acetyltransferase